jgi:dihydroorotase
MLDLLIADSEVVDATGVRRASIGISAGKVAIIPGRGERGEAARVVVDARGLLILPGLVDAHVHLREPGLTHKEGFFTGTQAAAAGGVTTVMIMPTDNPFTLTPADFTDKRALAEGQCHVDFALQAGLGPDLSHIEALHALGAVSFEMFMADMPPALQIDDDHVLRAALRRIAEIGAIAGVTPGSDAIVKPLTAACQDDPRPAAFNRSRPPAAEAVGVARAAVLAAEAGTRTVFRQVSCAASLAAYRHLRAHAPLYGEAMIHNLMLDEREIERQGPIAKVVPPLRPQADVEALRLALREGALDFIATDHAPHLPSEKEPGHANIWKAPSGFPGLQTLLPMLLQAEAEGLVDLPAIVRFCAETPARLFGLYPRKGALTPGADADLVLVERGPFVIDAADQLSKARLTPFAGRRVPGRVAATYLRGEKVFEHGSIIGSPRGQFLHPNR